MERAEPIPKSFGDIVEYVKYVTKIAEENRCGIWYRARTWPFGDYFPSLSNILDDVGVRLHGQYEQEQGELLIKLDEPFYELGWVSFCFESGHRVGVVYFEGSAYLLEPCYFEFSEDEEHDVFAQCILQHNIVSICKVWAFAPGRPTEVKKRIIGVMRTASFDIVGYLLDAIESGSLKRCFEDAKEPEDIVDEPGALVEVVMNLRPGKLPPRISITKVWKYAEKFLNEPCHKLTVHVVERFFDVDFGCFSGFLIQSYIEEVSGI